MGSVVKKRRKTKFGRKIFSRVMPWQRKDEGGEKGAQGFQGGAAPQAELNRFRKENKRLKMAREILIKAAAFFAKETS